MSKATSASVRLSLEMQNITGIHEILNVTRTYIEDELEERNHRRQHAGLEGGPDQLCDSFVRIFTPRGHSSG